MDRKDFDPPLQACNLCKSPNISFRLQDHKGVNIFQCDHCAIQFMNPQYTDRFLEDFYQSYQEVDHTNHRYGDDTGLRISIHRKNLEDIEKYSQPGKFLSVGCGAGHDLIAARERGWLPQGYEVDPEFCAALSDELNIPVRSGDFLSLDYPTEEFACVYLNHVLEHPKDPAAYLRKCHQLLKQGGVLYIACPNIKSISIHYKRVKEKVGMQKSVGKYYDSWQHLFYYSPSTLPPVLEEYFGFQVRLVGNDRKYKPNQAGLSRRWADYLAKHAPYKSSFRLIAQKKSGQEQ